MAYLQRFEPGLLRANEVATGDRRCGSLLLSPCCMVLTPLGILAAGSAWGEWSVEEFAQASPDVQEVWRILERAAPQMARRLKNGDRHGVSALLGRGG